MRAQVTVFIILGILIVIAFGVVFYASSLVSQPTRVRETAQVQSVRDYVTSCLERTVKDALVLAGQQGGRIFVDQGGVFPESNGVEVDDVFVPFTIIPPDGRVAFYDSHPPVYPFEGFPFIDDEKVFHGFYGFNRLPALYMQSPEGVIVNRSIQHAIEVYVENALPQCANWSSFQFDVAADDPNVSVIMARNATDLPNEQFVSVMLHWPIRAVGEGVTRLDEFAVRIPVRLSSVYFFVKGLVDADVSNARFVPDDDRSFGVEVIPVGDHDVVRVSDALSVVDGVPFEFWFARENRRPALWFVDAQDLVVHTGASIAIEDDYLVFDDRCDNEVYAFPLNATDPDEDAISYRFDVPDGLRNEPGSYTVRVFASDGSTHAYPMLWEDYQDINVQVVACV